MLGSGPTTGRKGVGAGGAGRWGIEVGASGSPAVAADEERPGQVLRANLARALWTVVPGQSKQPQRLPCLTSWCVFAGSAVWLSWGVDGLWASSGGSFAGRSGCEGWPGDGPPGHTDRAKRARDCQTTERRQSLHSQRFPFCVMRCGLLVLCGAPVWLRVCGCWGLIPTAGGTLLRRILAGR